MMRELVAQGKIEEAISFPFHPDVRPTTLDDVMTGQDLEDRRLAALILSVKAPKENAKPLRYTNKEKAITYHRLILCRDLLLGKEFYLLTDSYHTTDRYFSLLKTHTFYGQEMVLLEPEYSGEKIMEVPLLTLEEPIAPAQAQADNYKLDDIIVDSGKNIVKTFLISSLEIDLIFAKLITSCPSHFCDSYHDRAPCPSHIPLSASASPRRVLSFSITVTEHSITRVKFRSATTSKFFVAENLLASHNLQFDHRRLRASVRRTLTHYQNAAIPWILSGWYKRSMDSDTKKIHVGYLKPRDVLPDAPLFEANPERILPELNMQPRERRRRAGNVVNDEFPRFREPLAPAGADGGAADGAAGVAPRNREELDSDAPSSPLPPLSP